MEMNALNPTRLARLQSRMAVQSAPLWLMKPMLPGSASGLANVAFKPMCGSITPTQFGPMIRIRPRCARISFSSSSAGWSAFLESGGDDDRALHAGGRAFANDARDRCRRAWRSRPDRWLRKFADCPECLFPKDRRVLWIHWENAAAKRLKILHQRASHTGGLFARPDQSDRFRRKHRLENRAPIRQSIANAFVFRRSCPAHTNTIVSLECVVQLVRSWLLLFNSCLENLPGRRATALFQKSSLPHWLR